MSIPTGATSEAGPQLVGPPSSYPNPHLTPGAVFPNATKQDICTPGYAKRARNVSKEKKAEVYRRYGVDKFPPGKGEVDHFIPLCLGGNNDLENLWPEPDLPETGFRQKDVAAVYLHNQVCSGQMALADAQAAIRTDWIKVYNEIPHLEKEMILLTLE
jgi:hypothetical protein